MYRTYLKCVAIAACLFWLEQAQALPVCEKNISAPCVINSSGTYNVTANFTAPGTAIALDRGGESVVINGNNHVVTFANSGPGIGIGAGSTTGTYLDINSLEVFNLKLKNGSYALRANEKIAGISLKVSSTGLNIHNNEITLNYNNGSTTASGKAIEFGGPNTGASATGIISSNNISVTGPRAGSGIFYDSYGGTWNGEISGNTINVVSAHFPEPSAGYPRAILMAGLAKAAIKNNTIKISAPAGTWGPQGISLLEGSGYTIEGNKITQSAGASRGILIDYGSDHNIIRNNSITISMAQGIGAVSSGIRIRYGADYNEVSGNRVDATAGDNSMAIRLGGVSEYGTPTGNVVYKNQFINNHPTNSGNRAVSMEENAGGKWTFIDNDIQATGAGTALVIQDGLDKTSFNYTGSPGAVGSIKGKIRIVADKPVNLSFCAISGDNASPIRSVSDPQFSISYGTPTITFPTTCVQPGGSISNIQAAPNPPSGIM